MCAGGKDKKKETKLGLTATKAGNFPEWYTEVVREAELISYYTVSGMSLGVTLTARGLRGRT